MTATLSVAALWMALALIADALAFWLSVSSPVVEVIIGMVAQLVLGPAILGTNHEWVKFFSVRGAILLTFLAGTEIEPSVLKLNWKQAGVIGLMSFFVPFGLCAGAANVYLGWDLKPSWLAGIAMSTTSAAVVYAVMLQFGLSTSQFGKTILIATFVTDVATVLTLDLILTPFTKKTLIAFGGAATILLVRPWLTSRFLNQFGGLLSEIETKFLLVFLLGLGALATWPDSEAVFAGHRNGAFGTCWPESRVNPAFAYGNFRIADTVLFHSRGFPCFDSLGYRVTNALPNSSHSQSLRQIR